MPVQGNFRRASTVHKLCFIVGRWLTMAVKAVNSKFWMDIEGGVKTLKDITL